MEQKFHLVHEKKIRLEQKIHLNSTEKKGQGGKKNFKIVKRPCSLNRYYRVNAVVYYYCVYYEFYERDIVISLISETVIFFSLKYGTDDLQSVLDSYIMAIRVVEFSNGGYKIRKVFA